MHAFPPLHTEPYNAGQAVLSMPNTDSVLPTVTAEPAAEGAHRLLALPSFARVVYPAPPGMQSAAADTHLDRQLNSSLSRQPSNAAARLPDAASAAATVSAAASGTSQQPALQHTSSLRAESLTFDSQFESGNLLKAVQASCCSVPTGV